MTIAEFAALLKANLDSSTVSAIKADLGNKLANSEDPPLPVVGELFEALIHTT